MAKINDPIRIYYDPLGHTLTVWFGDPAAEYVCEETDDEIILMKDKEGRTIGSEKLNYRTPTGQPPKLYFEAITGTEEGRRQDDSLCKE